VSRTTVADVIVDGLRRAGTPRLFGVEGTSADSPLLEAARAIALPITLATSSAGACVMAAVTGELVEAPGAVVISERAPLSAPASAIALAMADRAPMIVLTSGHPSTVAGCKETLGVEAGTAAHRIAHAARLSMTTPRGPVHLDLAADVAERAAVPLATSCRPDVLPYPAADALDRAAEALAGASRPLLLAGLHCRSDDAAQWLRAFAEAMPAPLLATARAKGALPDPHPLMLGVLGLVGVEERLLGRADLVVAIGLDALEPVPAACWSTRPVLAFGPAALDDRTPAVQVVGDVGVVIEELAVRLRDKARADWDVAELDRLRREAIARGPGDGLAARILRLAREATPAGTIATVDAGAHHACVAAAWHAIAPREFLTSSALGASGFALPAAIAAHLVHPGRRVVCFTNPAGLMAAASELELTARLLAPVVIVVLDDAAPNVADLVRMAESVGVSVSAVESEPAFARALSGALGIAGPSLIVARPVADM
jgi:acetolactate synthase-1/2/3 large subunit